LNTKPRKGKLKFFMKDIKYLLAYLLPLSTWYALQIQGSWSFATVLLAFGILPIFDVIFPASESNHPTEKEDSRSKMVIFDLLLYACMPICYYLVFLFFQTIKTHDLTSFEQIGLLCSVGTLLGSMAINVAHELGHRNKKFDQFLSKTLLLPVLYQHFFIEHNRGHHKNVSTDADPASARKGEIIYTYWFRSILGQYKDAWKIENEGFKKAEKSVLTWKNEMVRFTIFQLLYLAVVAYFWGIEMLIFAIGIALFGVLLLETVNYIEHYGLRRKILPSGRPEPVLPSHSWNSNHEMGRVFLFELTRHSDHHFKSNRKYQVLRHMEDSPQLPTGYPGCMLMALVPPVWFAVMKNRV
jgi:alkane 1-monooxygenase